MSISNAELVRALILRDLTDPAQGPHAMQVLLDSIHAALPAPVLVHRASPIVSIADNYDRLGYPPDGAARDARYTRYVCDTALLRTQTSAMIPPLVARARDERDVVLSCPGLVYRRDVIDRLHVGEPGDRVREALGDRAVLVEAVELLSSTPAPELADAAAARLGIAAHQHNLLVRVTLRALDRSLTHDECNVLRDDIYAALHRGTTHQWARRG